MVPGIWIANYLNNKQVKVHCSIQMFAIQIPTVFAKDSIPFTIDWTLTDFVWRQFKLAAKMAVILSKNI